jgi:hypothetical protein
MKKTTKRNNKSIVIDTKPPVVTGGFYFPHVYYVKRGEAMGQKSAETQVGATEKGIVEQLSNEVLDGFTEIERLEAEAKAAGARAEEIRTGLAAQIGSLPKADFDDLLQVLKDPSDFDAVTEMDYEAQLERRARVGGRARQWIKNNNITHRPLTDEEKAAEQAARDAREIREEQGRIQRHMMFLRDDRDRLVEAFTRAGFDTDGIGITEPIVLLHEDNKFYKTYYARIRVEEDRIVLDDLTPHAGKDGQEWYYRSSDIDLSTGYYRQDTENQRGKATYEGVPYDDADAFSNIPGVFLAQMSDSLHELMGDIYAFGSNSTRGKRLSLGEFDFDATLTKIRTERSADSEYGMLKRIAEMIEGIAHYGSLQDGQDVPDVYEYKTEHMTVMVAATTDRWQNEESKSAGVRVEYTNPDGHKVSEDYLGFANQNQLGPRRRVISDDPSKEKAGSQISTLTHEDIVMLKSLLDYILPTTQSQK